MPEFVVGARWVVEAENHAAATELLAGVLRVHVNAGCDGGVPGTEFLGVYQSSDSPSDAREMVERAVPYTRSNEPQ